VEGGVEVVVRGRGGWIVRLYMGTGLEVELQVALGWRLSGVGFWVLGGISLVVWRGKMVSEVHGRREYACPSDENDTLTASTQ
jgi:hypothetical protein